MRIEHGFHGSELMSDNNDDNSRSKLAEKEDHNEEYSTASGSYPESETEQFTTNNRTLSERKVKVDVETKSGSVNAPAGEVESRSKSRKNSRPVKNVQETESGIEIIKPTGEAVIVKSEPKETETSINSDDSRSTGYDSNWIPGVHKIGSETYLSKPTYDPGRSAKGSYVLSFMREKSPNRSGARNFPGLRGNLYSTRKPVVLIYA